MASLDALIRRPTEEDLHTLHEIECLCFSEPWSETSLRLLCSDAYPSCVAIKDNTVVGYVGSQRVLDELQITNVAVHPSARRAGIASALLEEFHKMARELDITLISLEVRESNLGARALYEEFGYVTVGKRRGFYKNPREDADRKSVV